VMAIFFKWPLIWLYISGHSLASAQGLYTKASTK
jgi:hypothetical protein